MRFVKRMRGGGAKRRWRIAGVAVVAAVVAAAVLGAAWAWRDGAVSRLAVAAHGALIALTAEAGFKVREIYVVGRVETNNADLLGALDLARGVPILAFDPHAAKARIERLAWVRAATVERILPDTVLVRIQERRPLALWQHSGAFALIDETGAVVLRKGLERFTGLPVVVGEDAPAHARALLAMLGSEPELMRRVKAAVRVGRRRWNLVMDAGVDVRLPEDDAAAAWARLAEYERLHRVLDRDVQVLDLRLPDRLIMRRPPKPEKAGTGAGRQT